MLHKQSYGEELLFLVVDIHIVWRLLIALLLMLVVEFTCKLVLSGTATLINNSAGFGGYSCSHNNPDPNYFGGGINMLNGDLYVTGNMLLCYGYILVVKVGG